MSSVGGYRGYYGNRRLFDVAGVTKGNRRLFDVAGVTKGNRRLFDVAGVTKGIGGFLMLLELLRESEVV